MTSCVTRFRMWVIFLIALLIGGCSGGAVQFAPSSILDADALIRYEHPGGAFSLAIPRAWAIYEMNTTLLASAALTPPTGTTPLLLFAVVNAENAFDDVQFEAWITRYTSELRLDARHFVEQGRDRLADASWRVAGYRRAVEGNLPVNLFFQRVGTLIALIEYTPPNVIDPDLAVAIDQIINSFSVTAASPLLPTSADTLSAARSSPLTAINVRAWTALDGALFVTGEVVNNTPGVIAPVPIDVQILTSDGSPLTGAADVVMGYGLFSGGFAPFSVRFGEGQPAGAAVYSIRIGADGWTPEPASFLGTNDLRWTDQLTAERDGSLLISGEITNTSDQQLRAVRAVATVFDSDGAVIAAGQTEYADVPLSAGETRPYEIVLSALGDAPFQYTVFVQGIP